MKGLGTKINFSKRILLRKKIKVQNFIIKVERVFLEIYLPYLNLLLTLIFFLQKLMLIFYLPLNNFNFFGDQINAYHRYVLVILSIFYVFYKFFKKIH